MEAKEGDAKNESKGDSYLIWGLKNSPQHCCSGSNPPWVKATPLFKNPGSTLYYMLDTRVSDTR